MSADALIGAIESSAPAVWMRGTVPAMPAVESVHVLTAVTVLGVLLIVDLRLLGLRDRPRALTRISAELLPIAWVAFGAAVVTGALMFSTNAHTYFFNAAFRIKLLALVCAGLNMAFFHLVTFRGVAAWRANARPPRAARVAGALSLLLWACVVLLGRWIGFTKGYDFSIPDGVDLDFTLGN
jgi:hypothetical protein